MLIMVLLLKNDTLLIIRIDSIMIKLNKYFYVISLFYKLGLKTQSFGFLNVRTCNLFYTLYNYS